MFELSAIEDDDTPFWYLNYQHGKMFIVTNTSTNSVTREVLSKTETIYIHGDPGNFASHHEELRQADKIVRVFPDGSKRVLKDRDGPV